MFIKEKNYFARAAAHLPATAHSKFAIEGLIRGQTDWRLAGAKLGGEATSGN